MRTHLVFAAMLLLSVPGFARAEGLLLSVGQTTYHSGDSFTVSVYLNGAPRGVNTVSAILRIPPERFSILDARSGNSIISLWVERPRVNRADGSVSFAGGLPGGFAGTRGLVLTLGLRALAPGSASISFSDARLLLNDGLGTEVEHPSVGSLTLAVTPPAPRPVAPAPVPVPSAEYTPPPDRAAPEPFVPLVSRHPSIGENRYFVSFAAVDKDSGIDHYEVREILRFLPSFAAPPRWVRAESPYILAHQWWGSDITVRAIDQAGNAADGTAIKPFDSRPIGLAAALAGALIALALWFLRRRLGLRL